MTLLETITGFLKPFYTRIIISIVIVVLGLFVGKLLGRFVKKVLSEIELDRFIKTATGVSLRLESLIGTFVTYFIYFVFVVWALENVGLGSIILNIVASGIVIIIILSLLLGLKDFIPNLFAGLFLHFKGIIKENDRIKFENVEGKVLRVDLVETRIQTKGKDIIYVPNSILVRTKIIKKA